MKVAQTTYQLTQGQQLALLALTKALREDLILLEYVVQIKQALAGDGDMDARALWNELDDMEQSILWVAPKYGGIFTTDERKRLRR